MREFLAVPGAYIAGQGMGTGAEADVRCPAPIGAVVDGFEAGLCEIGDFVMMVAGPPKTSSQDVVLPATLFLGSLNVTPVGYHLGKGASFLY